MYDSNAMKRALWPSYESIKEKEILFNFPQFLQLKFINRQP